MATTTRATTIFVNLLQIPRSTFIAASKSRPPCGGKKFIRSPVEMFVVHQLAIGTEGQSQVVAWRVGGTITGRGQPETVRRRDVRLWHHDVVACPQQPIGDDGVVGKLLTAVRRAIIKDGLVEGIIPDAV